MDGFGGSEILVFSENMVICKLDETSRLHRSESDNGGLIGGDLRDILVFQGLVINSHRAGKTRYCAIHSKGSST